MLLVLGVDTVAWAWACRRLDDGIGEAATALGWTVEAAPRRWSGWPLAAEVALTNAILHTGPAIVPPIMWEVPQLDLRVPLWSPTWLTASAQGRQAMAVGGSRPVTFTAAALTAGIDLTQQLPPRIDGTDVAIDGGLGPIKLGALTLHLPAGGWSAAATGVTFPGRDGRSITPPIDSLQLNGRMDPPIEPMPTARLSAEAWRGRHGQLSLELVRLRWGALDAAAQATLTLGPTLQPALAGTVTTNGLAAILAQLADNGAITPGGSTAAQAMLAILAAPTGGGPVTLPITVQDGIVSVARFPLLRLAPLQWD